MSEELQHQILTWNQFQKSHSGIKISKTELSAAYAKHKKGKYNPPLCDLRNKKSCNYQDHICIWSGKSCYLE